MKSDLDDLPALINENKTRKKLIDPVLKKYGWYKQYIKEEVNSVKSDFAGKQLVYFEGSFQKGVDRFIDYVLLDENNNVLAIIEAKSFAKDAKSGRIQARTYSKDIESQVNRKVPIFLTNGRKWFLIDEDGIEREVSGPFSQEDLKRRNDLFHKREVPKDVAINDEIVDRPRSVQIVRKLSEHFSEGHRKALVHMATGTGKTRVAMAIIDLLIKANVIQNVLFLADRTSLVDQAKTNGFQEFFTEPVEDLREGFSTSGRLYVCTVQSMMSRKPRIFVERFSPGFFDLIVFDEAHRSIYDANKAIDKYFDAIKIGLTATPRKHEAKSTYEMFDCKEEGPTVEYSYEDALRDGVLVPYTAEIIETEVLSEGIKGKKLSAKLKDDLRRQEIDPDSVDFSGSEFDRVFMDDRTNELIIREFMATCYKSDEGKPCKSIFFCASKRHAEYMKNIFGKLFPKMGNEVQVITSGHYRAIDEIKRFKLESEPRIALSVGMLDTGVDIPEVCNLVFVKPVFSGIRFWQMIGRGTRNFESCKHPEWLSETTKKDFKIFDFKIGGHSNIKFHEFKVSTERAPQKDVLTKIFDNRVNLLEKPLTDDQKKLISGKVIQSVEALDTSSFFVRPKSDIVDRVKEHSFDLENYMEDLRKEIAPLLVMNPGENADVSSFILQAEKLFALILDCRYDQIYEIRNYVREKAANILQKEASLMVIKENKDKITKVLQQEFWQDLTFEDVEFIVRELAPLMVYYEPTPGKIALINKKDTVLTREHYEREVKEDEELLSFLDKNPLIKNIKDGMGITSLELKALENQLSSLRPEITVENVQKFRQKDFITFLKEILGLPNEADPKTLIETKFDEFIIRSHYYNSQQMNFLILLKKVFAERKYVEISDFGKPPLSDEHPLEYFQLSDLQFIVDQCNEIPVA